MNLVKKLIFHILATALVFWALEEYVFPEELIIKGGVVAYPVIAFVFGLLNIVLKPILTILTFPIHLLSLGLSSVLLNALMLWFLAQGLAFLDIAGIGIVVTELMTYILLGICLSVAHFFIHWFES